MGRASTGCECDRESRTAVQTGGGCGVARTATVRRTGGAAVVLVSHDMKAVRALATRAVWLENGHVKMIGNPEDVVAAYEAN